MPEVAVAKATDEATPEPDPPRGIVCPRCACPWTRVYCTRPLTGNKVRQYRRCGHCDYAFVTTIVVGATREAK